MTDRTSRESSLRTYCVAVLLAAALLIGCARKPAEVDVPKHASAQEKARARQAIGEQQSQHPTEPPTADQMSPSSPNAVLDGTSTTQPATTPPPTTPPRQTNTPPR